MTIKVPKYYAQEFQKKVCSRTKIIIPGFTALCFKTENRVFFGKIYSSRSEKWTFSECPFFETSTISFLRNNIIE